MIDPDELMRAEFAFSAATERLRKCEPGKHGFGIENSYANAYQRLVGLGARRQIKLKYRRGQ